MKWLIFFKYQLNIKKNYYKGEKKMINLNKKIVKELTEGAHLATLEDYGVKEQQRIDTETGELIKIEFLELSIKADNEQTAQPIRIYENGLNWLAQGLQSQIADLIQPNSGSHNSIYRGKFLGNSVTNLQYQALKDGTFTDLFIGDYWTIGDVNYRIAAFVLSVESRSSAALSVSSFFAKWNRI